MAHSNLQPEFLLLDKNFNLKVSDFCMHDDGNCVTKGVYDAKTFGNGIHLAPEVLSGKPFDKI
jgi:hypothetical protein